MCSSDLGDLLQLVQRLAVADAGDQVGVLLNVRAGLTPTARQSGPRSGRGKKGHGNTYAKRITVLAAYAAANTDTFLGERFRRLASRPGGGGRKKAGCAVGRSILIIVWHLLNDPAARYRDLGPDWHARHTDRSRKARNARRQLEALGFDVVITLREDAA